MKIMGKDKALKKHNSQGPLEPLVTTFVERSRTHMISMIPNNL